MQYVISHPYDMFMRKHTRLLILIYKKNLGYYTFFEAYCFSSNVSLIAEYLAQPGFNGSDIIFWPCSKSHFITLSFSRNRPPSFIFKPKQHKSLETILKTDFACYFFQMRYCCCHVALKHIETLLDFKCILFSRLIQNEIFLLVLASIYSHAS